MALLEIQQVIDTVSVAQEGLVSPEVPDSISVMDLVMKGGWTMAILGALLAVAVYALVERILTLKKAKADPEELLNKVSASVIKGDIEQAKKHCDTQNTPMARMLYTGLIHIGSSLKNIEASIENVGKLEIYRLEKNISVLGTISGAAPMIGFFGTVIGMIKAFISISQEEGSVSPKLLSAGIYEAMITTAGGLFVGILAYIAYNYLVRQVSDVIHRMEITSIEFIDLLQKPN
ncbi:MotA/TolQ/ExbB proton channel family protein [Flammeovirgaceae bacterium SG7u.111]|nr:MotA/TolQ/ExbB proton channel family protein [Flammeovirgaceae bacterium SG7u.132]WPO33192.1 MotA/TolQ/ExbB proton channel family protein [Flammeovirgaceae bacterium SG7u.111]